MRVNEEDSIGVLCDIYVFGWCWVVLVDEVENRINDFTSTLVNLSMDDGSIHVGINFEIRAQDANQFVNGQLHELFICPVAVSLVFVSELKQSCDEPLELHINVRKGNQNSRIKRVHINLNHFVECFVSKSTVEPDSNVFIVCGTSVSPIVRIYTELTHCLNDCYSANLLIIVFVRFKTTCKCSQEFRVVTILIDH